MKSLCGLIVAVMFGLLTRPTPGRGADAAALPDAVGAFLDTHCRDCHAESDATAGFDVRSLEARLSNPQTYQKWVRLFDRVHDGEMPPAEASPVPAAERRRFVSTLETWLRDVKSADDAQQGRVRGRRLTNLQLERTLHDLLGIDIPLAAELPDEPRTAGFTTVADGQSMSHFQLEQQLTVIDKALDEAFRRATHPPDEWQRTFDAQQTSRENPRRRCREPELLRGQAVVWSGGPIFYGRLPVTTAREEGWYRITLRASALNRPEDQGVWCTVRTGKCVSSAPLMGWAGAFEAQDDPQEWTFEAWLPRGHMFEVRPGDTTLKKGRFEGGQVGAGEGEPQKLPGVALHSVELERIHRGPGNGQIRQWLLGSLDVQPVQKRSPASVHSSAPHDDARQLLQRFAERAFRRPVAADDIAPYVALVDAALDGEASFLEALRGGYRALLCSPRFLYFHEQPGPLDDHAIAARLSYFLWNSTPDETLMRLASAGQLSDPDELQKQVDRMLSDARGKAFVRDFAGEWLDLNEIDFTEPDRKLYPDFDVIVQQSMVEETQMFLQEMLDEDQSVSKLIDSDATYLNSRLARFYDIRGVQGDSLQRVALEPEHHRGGVLTQGAILKVTANGTTTSPVIRGVWISERLLGVEIPPPPAGVPAIEPDIRGASTIREMLAKHRSDPACASCHVKMDPAGFALESFDPAGQWRTHYQLAGSGRRKAGPAIDASYQLPDGRTFADVDEFQALILSDPARIARNVVQHLVTYGTGAPVSFADRPAVEDIVRQAAKSDYGLRSLIAATITSPVFLSK